MFIEAISQRLCLVILVNGRQQEVIGAWAEVS